MEALVFLYIFVVLGIPIFLILLNPFIYAFITLRNRSRYKSAEFSNQFLVEYQPPKNLSPAELGFLFDEHARKNEVWSSLLTSSQKKNDLTEATDYEKQAIAIYEHEDLSLLFTGRKSNLFASKQLSIDYASEIRKYRELLRESLACKQLVIGEKEEKEKISKRRQKYSQLSRYISFLTFFVPFSVSLVIEYYPNILDIIMAIIVLIVFWYLHSAMIHVSLMLNRHITDTGPVLSLNDSVITRDIWDELRGYRYFLKKVEAPRAKTFFNQGDVKYLSSERFSQLVAFGFVGDKYAKKAYDLIKK